MCVHYFLLCYPGRFRNSSWFASSFPYLFHVQIIGKKWVVSPCETNKWLSCVWDRIRNDMESKGWPYKIRYTKRKKKFSVHWSSTRKLSELLMKAAERIEPTVIAWLLSQLFPKYNQQYTACTSVISSERMKCCSQRRVWKDASGLKGNPCHCVEGNIFPCLCLLYCCLCMFVILSYWWFKVIPKRKWSSFICFVSLPH